MVALEGGEESVESRSDFLVFTAEEVDVRADEGRGSSLSEST